MRMGRKASEKAYKDGNKEQKASVHGVTFHGKVVTRALRQAFDGTGRDGDVKPPGPFGIGSGTAGWEIHEAKKLPASRAGVAVDAKGEHGLVVVGNLSPGNAVRVAAARVLHVHKAFRPREKRVTGVKMIP